MPELEAARRYLPQLVLGVISGLIVVVIVAVASTELVVVFLLGFLVLAAILWLLAVVREHVWRGFLVVLKIPGMSLGLVCRAASRAAKRCWVLICEPWRKWCAMRRERLKRRVIEKLRCYEARGELPAEQVAALVQAIALL